MRRVSSGLLWPVFGIALWAASSGCSSISPLGFGRDGPAVSRERALARCLDATPGDQVLYPDRLAGCMEGYGWSYALKRRY